jgi:hypothetical protein
MSKRVLVLFGVGVLLIVGAFFLLKYELTEKDQDADPEEDINQEQQIIADEKQTDQPGAGTETN